MKRWIVAGAIVAAFIIVYYLGWTMCNDCPTSDLLLPWKILGAFGPAP